MIGELFRELPVVPVLWRGVAGCCDEERVLGVGHWVNVDVEVASSQTGSLLGPDKKTLASTFTIGAPSAGCLIWLLPIGSTPGLGLAVVGRQGVPWTEEVAGSHSLPRLRRQGTSG